MECEIYVGICIPYLLGDIYVIVCVLHKRSPITYYVYNIYHTSKLSIDRILYIWVVMVISGHKKINAYRVR